MAKLSNPRAGSLQFWPRKRAEKAIPSVNWTTITAKEGLLGFIGYKVGMGTAIVKDVTSNSMTLNKKIAVPVTILEVPNAKIYSVRFYKNDKVVKEVVVSNDKELKRATRVPKQLKNFDSEAPKEFDDIRIIIYSLAKTTAVKKTPDLTEVAINKPDKLAYVKSMIGKEIAFTEFAQTSLVDVRGLTKGKGLSGPVKRFGVTLKNHKSEKGVRRPGSLAPWHPARVTFRAPMAGQLGMFTRVHYNLNFISHGNVSEKNINPSSGFKQYGNVKTSYVIIKGSVQGPQKRQILMTPSFRPTRNQQKKKFEFMELVA